MPTPIIVQCSICGQMKSADDFYHRANGNAYKWCKTCHQAKTHPDTPKEPKAGYVIEQTVLEILMSKGIFTAHGRYSQFSHIDLIAWGCVKIEVKSAEGCEGSFNFVFSDGQLEGLCDCYIFVGTNQGAVEWLSVIPVEELKPCLVRQNLVYHYNPKYLKSRESEIFQQLIRKYRDGYLVIEHKRLSLAKEGFKNV